MYSNTWAGLDGGSFHLARKRVASTFSGGNIQYTGITLSEMNLYSQIVITIKCNLKILKLCELTLWKPAPSTVELVKITNTQNIDFARFLV